MSVNHNNIKLKNNNAENQPFTCTETQKNTNISLEASPIENLDTIIHTRPTDTYVNELTKLQKHILIPHYKMMEHSFGQDLIEQDKLIFHPQANAPPIFRVKTNPSPFICQKIHYKFDRYTKKHSRIFCTLQSSTKILSDKES